MARRNSAFSVGDTEVNAATRSLSDIAANAAFLSLGVIEAGKLPVLASVFLLSLFVLVATARWLSLSAMFEEKLSTSL